MYSTYNGSFSMNTGAGNQSITGVGFVPKAIFFYYNKETTNGSADSQVTGFGMATSATNRVGVCVRGLNGANPTSAGRRHDNTSCIVYCDGTGAAVVDADFVSMDANGFTINVTTADATARVINFIALGGSDLTHVFIKEWTTPTTVSSQATTGVGFQPDAMIVLSLALGTSPVDGAGSASALCMLGFGTSATQQGAMGIRPGNGVSPQITEKIQKAGKIMCQSNSTLFMEADLVTMDEDGFTLNFSTTSGTARYAWALCLKGGQYKVGSFNQPTSQGNVSLADVGFTPKGLCLFSSNGVTSTSIIEEGRHSFGAASSPIERGSIWFGDQDNVAAQVVDEDLDRTKIIKMMTEGTPTVNAAADLASFDSDGFTLNWTAADATAREIIYMAFGGSVGTLFNNFQTVGSISQNVLSVA